MDAFSIIVQNDTGSLPALPDNLAENADSFVKQHPGIGHRVIFNDEIETILDEHFPPEILRAYRKLVPFAYKADLARYCILHLRGGASISTSRSISRPRFRCGTER